MLFIIFNQIIINSNKNELKKSIKANQGRKTG